MKAQLINSLGCVIGYISEDKTDVALKLMADAWLPLLSEGDTIKITSMSDDE